MFFNAYDSAYFIIEHIWFHICVFLNTHFIDFYRIKSRALNVNYYVVLNHQ